MQKKRDYKNLKLVGFIVGCAGLLASTMPSEKYFEIAKNLDIFTTLFKEVNAFYVDEVDPKKIIETGINAMLESLDPYTNYISEEDAADYRTMTTGEYAGIGSLIAQFNNKVVVTMPNEGFPAAKAGLKIGDEIIKVNGTETKGKSSGEVSKLLKGKPGTTVNLEVLQNGTLKKFTITRTTIVLPNVPYSGMLADNVGYIKLTDFTTNAAKEVKKAVKKLKSKGATSLVLDVRGNPGGLLYEAINIANIFIPKDKIVVETKGKQADWSQQYKTLNQAVDTQLPMVVLTNGGSASASEIVSGTLQDYDRAVLVGTKTFGKGLVQTTRQLPYNTQVKITTAKYYIPSGRCIQALDYTHRNDDGSVGKIPDSLKVAFKTQSGRVVYDGGGITPDVEVKDEFLSPISVSLLTQAHIFNYATHYYYGHPQAPDFGKFTLTDDEYKQFVAWLNNKKFDYTTRLEEAIDNLLKEEDNNLLQQVSPKLEELKSLVAHNKQQDLITYKKEIKELLEEEIMGRYYFTRGEIACSIAHDKTVTQAIDILQNTSKYNQLLQP